ncbi:MAG: hypothetical protein AVDCRST_MAG20-2302 [uncultured Acidimicrobiales bacterium]|uniref:Uncharacterized protein n=1 Tax=uncultured Acidimicrobiales bacterium TaxID=310071 RepID=A0A6J4IHC1_9ACTN|nr:MAG: hypothetical protein AVDCRST_MAG20-2302 [uncultured Acidimicrobiales bacterium]
MASSSWLSSPSSSRLGAPFTWSLLNGTCSSSPCTVALVIGTNVLLLPNRPVLTSAHSGSRVSWSK